MSATLQTIAIDSLVFRPQVRQHFDDRELQSLADSIGESGLQEPPVVWNDGERYVVMHGERRIRAMKLRGDTHVEVRVVACPESAAKLIELQLVSNSQRVDLNPVERAHAIQALLDQGLSPQEVGRKLVCNPSQITKALAPLKLSPELQTEIVSGRLSADSAYLLSREKDPKRQAVLAAEVLGNRLSRDSLARKMKRLGRTDAARQGGPSRITTMLGDGRSVTLAGKGLSLDSVIEWLEQLLARAKRAKAQSLSLETFARAMKDQAAKGVTP